MKRSFRRISAVIATMAFMTGLAACGSSQESKGGSQPDSSASSTLIPHGWKKFTSKLMGYSVCFPGTPEKDTYKDNGGFYVRYSTVDKNDNINYAVSASQFSSKQTEESKEFNESQRRKVLSNYAHLMGVKEGEYTFTTVDGHTAITYMGHASEDSSVILRRTVVFSPAGFYGLEAFGVPQKEYKQFVDTFQLSEDTQE